MPKPTLVQSTGISGPSGRKLRVLFYSNGSIRLRISKAGPMTISEAFLPGKNKDVILKLSPLGDQ